MVDVVEARIRFKSANKSLPVLPHGAPYLIKSLTDENIDLGKLSEIIERFPSISTRLIALANSAWSAPVDEITSLEMACSRLGFNVVKSTSIAIAISSPFDTSRCAAFNGLQYWTRAFTAAEVAAHLNTNVSSLAGLDSATVRTAGLIHNIGLLWLADNFPEEINQALQQKQQQPETSLRHHLQDILGFDHTHAGHYLAEAWGLPPLLDKVLGNFPDRSYAGDYDRYVNLTGVAVSITAGFEDEDPCLDGDLRLQKLSVTDSDLEQAVTMLQSKSQVINTLSGELFSH